MTKIKELPEILDIEQVSEWLHKHPSTIRRWARKGKISYRKIGPYYYFHRDTLEASFLQPSDDSAK